jgi:hypothetical protein
VRVCLTRNTFNNQTHTRIKKENFSIFWQEKKIETEEEWHRMAHRAEAEIRFQVSGNFLFKFFFSKIK